MRSEVRVLLCVLLGVVIARGQQGVPLAPPASAKGHAFHDRQFGVRFDVPAGWNFVRKDREVSTFLLDARSATAKSEMRGVAAIDFNPFPLSTFSGALFYYSVQRHTNDDDCASEAVKYGSSAKAAETVGGMDFARGHDEHGDICVESRDEVYTAYRKGSCYRFDLTVNTFCAESSGAAEMTRRQFENIEGRMEDILASVKFDWKPKARSGLKDAPERKPLPAPETAPRPARTLNGAL